MLLLSTACDEALFSPDNDKIPGGIPGGDGTPWVEFTSSDDPVGEPGDVVEVEVQPGVAIEEEISVSYEASGTAVAGTDYAIRSGASPVSIPFTFDDNNLDEGIIEIEILDTATDGRTLTMTLTGASSASFPSFDVGRGGTGIDRSRTLTISVP
jgi:hypothetical protein